VIAPCAVHIPIARVPARISVSRGGKAVGRPVRGHRTPGRLWLQRGDVIRVVRPASLTFSYAGNRFLLRHALVQLACHQVLFDPGAAQRRARVLVVSVRSGLVDARSGRSAPRRALVLTGELVAYPTRGGTSLEVDRNPLSSVSRARTFDQPIVVARAADMTLRLNTRVSYTAISDAHGLRLDVWPFSLSAAQRVPVAADRLVPFWADGQPCSVGCRSGGAIPGWPLKPFHRQHAIRSALNELRPANFHVALDIESRDGQPVYPIASGYVRVLQASGPEERVQVGPYVYWHIDRTVSTGRYAVAYRTELGTVKYHFRHVALSELGPGGEYLNPLRPAGRVLSPWSDTEPPVIGTPRVLADRRVIVSAFDPQSYVERSSYETPVLAPAALAWRLFDARGTALTALQWALRGSHNYAPALKPVVFAPGAVNPGFNCFAFKVICIPNWTYWLAGGVTERLPLSSLPHGRYRLAVYAWDWAGNASARDRWITVPGRTFDRAPRGAVIARPEPQ
jgi:hypothetical protein